MRTSLRYVADALDSIAVTAWALLALTLLVLVLGQALGAFDPPTSTPRPLQVHPVPAVAPHWQPPGHTAR
jgi:hypothetical protein